MNVSFGAKEKNFCSLEKDTITNGTITFKRFHKRAQAKFVIAFFPQDLVTRLKDISIKFRMKFL